MEIDPRFKAARKHAARRRTRSWLYPLLAGGAAVLALGLGVALYLGGALAPAPPVAEAPAEDDLAADPGASYASPFVDLPGDPMVLHFDRSGGVDKTRKLLRPPELTADRAGAELVLLNDDMITREERLITTLPSSREDFAFFQAQRQTPRAVIAAPAETVVPTSQPREVVVAAEDASWGEDLEGGAEAAPASYTRTAIENTTSLTFVLPETARRSPWEDVFLRLKDETDLTRLLTENGMEPTASARFAEETAALLPAVAKPAAGLIVALRGADRAGARVPVQASFYTRDSYIGSVALSDTGRVVMAADPWVAEDLFSFAGTESSAEVDTSRKYRLLDAFYSAAIRNGVPSAVVAETIVLMSQAFDLEAFASPGDEMTLLFAPTPGGEGPGPGQVLYAAITGRDRVLECHVFRLPGATDYSCYKAPGPGAPSGGGGVTLRGGMLTPVKGVLTSRYGPRMHPILKVAKLHRGVDWAAPTGTPVMAAFDGTILSAGDGKGYGNVVRISHAGGLETRYAHLNAFSDQARAGAAVKAGDVIGYVGTTGLSTGPHLHFELYQGGESVDPFASGSEGVTAGSAVEQLTDQIIRVESAGNATAKNPLSTATGLGQFIEGTWLRMMKTYRPDLADTMTREALLALRTDPTISREMVQNLAREGEAYLRARGHDITAGRLYLCHFLGADGAHRVLGAADDALLGDVLGAGVISANPFLKGRSVAYVKEWAEAKMSGRRANPTLPAAAVTPPEVLAYQKLIAGVIGAG
jgi:murein DD-endopeptidase MepM/ murein hydrolase activator NlpD